MKCFKAKLLFNTNVDALETPEPHYIPGYSGFVPQAQFRPGNTYGMTSHRVLMDPCIKMSTRSVLNNVHPEHCSDEFGRPGIGTDPFLSCQMAQVSSRANNLGRQQQYNMSPGYTGFLPKLQAILGHSPPCKRTSARFEQDQWCDRLFTKEIESLDGLGLCYKKNHSKPWETNEFSHAGNGDQESIHLPRLDVSDQMSRSFAVRDPFSSCSAPPDQLTRDLALPDQSNGYYSAAQDQLSHSFAVQNQQSHGSHVPDQLSQESNQGSHELRHESNQGSHGSQVADQRSRGSKVPDQRSRGSKVPDQRSRGSKLTDGGKKFGKRKSRFLIRDPSLADQVGWSFNLPVPFNNDSNSPYKRPSKGSSDRTLGQSVSEHWQRKCSKMAECLSRLTFQLSRGSNLPEELGSGSNHLSRCCELIDKLNDASNLPNQINRGSKCPSELKLGYQSIGEDWQKKCSKMAQCLSDVHNSLSNQPYRSSSDESFVEKIIREQLIKMQHEKDVVSKGDEMAIDELVDEENISRMSSVLVDKSICSQVKSLDPCSKASSLSLIGSPQQSKALPKEAEEAAIAGSKLPEQLSRGLTPIDKMNRGSEQPVLRSQGLGQPDQLSRGLILIDKMNRGSEQPDQRSQGLDQPDHSNRGSVLPVQLSRGSKLPEQMSQGSTSPDQLNRGSVLPEQLSRGSKLPAEISQGSTSPDHLIRSSVLPEQLSRGSKLPNQRNMGTNTKVPDQRKVASTVLEQLKSRYNLPDQLCPGCNLPDLLSRVVSTPPSPHRQGSKIPKKAPSKSHSELKLNQSATEDWQKKCSEMAQCLSDVHNSISKSPSNESFVEEIIKQQLTKLQHEKDVVCRGDDIAIDELADDENISRMSSILVDNCICSQACSKGSSLSLGSLDDNFLVDDESISRISSCIVKEAISEEVKLLDPCAKKSSRGSDSSSEGSFVEKIIMEQADKLQHEIDIIGQGDEAAIDELADDENMSRLSSAIVNKAICSQAKLLGPCADKSFMEYSQPKQQNSQSINNAIGSGVIGGPKEGAMSASAQIDDENISLISSDIVNAIVCDQAQLLDPCAEKSSHGTSQPEVLTNATYIDQNISLISSDIVNAVICDQAKLLDPCAEKSSDRTSQPEVLTNATYIDQSGQRGASYLDPNEQGTAPPEVLTNATYIDQAGQGGASYLDPNEQGISPVRSEIRMHLNSIRQELDNLKNQLTQQGIIKAPTPSDSRL